VVWAREHCIQVHVVLFQHPIQGLVQDEQLILGQPAPRHNGLVGYDHDQELRLQRFDSLYAARQQGQLGWFGQVVYFLDNRAIAVEKNGAPGSALPHASPQAGAGRAVEYGLERFVIGRRHIERHRP
jgi:hypothetical protein